MSIVSRTQQEYLVKLAKHHFGVTYLDSRQGGGVFRVLTRSASSMEFE